MKKRRIEPLHIVPEGEREELIKRGLIRFLHKNKRIDVPLINRSGSLQGAYTEGTGRILVLRYNPKTTPMNLKVRELVETHEGFNEKPILPESFFTTSPKLDGMFITPELEGRGLGTTGASITEKHVRSKNRGEHRFYVLPQMEDFFRRLGYTKTGKNKEGYAQIRKRTEPNPEDDLDRSHRIEVIFPEGREGVLTIPYQK